MAWFLEDIKAILSIRVKTRHDAIYDQYSRLFMPKILLISSFAVGLNWFRDKLTCVVPDNVALSKDFVSDACWINGFFIFKNMSVSKRGGYYGIPADINFDGKYQNDKFCMTTGRDGVEDKDCIAMEKIYFLQYQWYPFFLASMALVYYLPHIIFKLVNIDLISLKNAVKRSTPNEIIATYFNFRVNSLLRMRIKILANIGVKVLYITANLLTLFLADVSLNNKFISYGKDWIRWTSQNNTMMYDKMGNHGKSRPGELLLPSFGLCIIHEGSLDKKYSVVNQHKFICEYSSHVLYNYVLITLWFFIIFGIIISITGLLFYMGNHIFALLCLIKRGENNLLNTLTLRETEYLDYIRRKNLALYGVIVKKLRGERLYKKHGRNPKYESLEKRLEEIANQLEVLNRNVVDQ